MGTPAFLKVFADQNDLTRPTWAPFATAKVPTGVPTSTARTGSPLPPAGPKGKVCFNCSGELSRFPWFCDNCARMAFFVAALAGTGGITLGGVSLHTLFHLIVPEE